MVLVTPFCRVGEGVISGCSGIRTAGLRSKTTIAVVRGTRVRKMAERVGDMPTSRSITAECKSLC